MYGVKRTNHVTFEEGAKLAEFANTLPQQPKQTTYNPLNIVDIGSRKYNLTGVPVFVSYRQPNSLPKPMPTTFNGKEYTSSTDVFIARMIDKSNGNN